MALDANSYASDAELLAYADGSVTPLVAEPAARERALRSATRMIDRLSFRGTARLREQALAWPRDSVTDPDRWGYLLSETQVPRRVREACCELAISLLTNGAPDQALPDASLYKRVKVDVLEAEYRDGAATSTTAAGVIQRTPAAWALLAPLTELGGGVMVHRA
jgi:hypothetical protein